MFVLLCDHSIEGLVGVPACPGGFDVFNGVYDPREVLAVIEPRELLFLAWVDPCGALPPLRKGWPVLGAVGEWDEVDERDVREDQQRCRTIGEEKVAFSGGIEFRAVFDETRGIGGDLEIVEGLISVAG